MSGRADVSPATRGTNDEPTEEELGCVASPRRCVFAALSQKALCLGEDVNFDERSMGRVLLHVAEGDLAYVRGIAQDIEHADVAP